MNRNIGKAIPAFTSLIVINLFFAVFGVAQTEYESYYLRSSNYPSYGNLWTPTQGFEDREIQGVTHDNDNWYFTWTDKDPKIGYLWKVPVNIPLDNNLLESGSVDIINTRMFSDLNGGVIGVYSENAYWHWGDPDRYTYEGTDYVVVPMTGPEPPIIAIFNAGNLNLVAYGKLMQQPPIWCPPGSSAPIGQKSTGWCAINPKTGILYTSEDFDYTLCFPKICIGGTNNGLPCEVAADCPGSLVGCGTNDCDYQDYYFDYPRELLRYEIPWDIIEPSNNIGEIPLTPIEPRLKFLPGSGEFQELYNMQGGEFTPSGEMLYISSGSGCCFGYGVGQQYALDGLHVFDTLTWREIKRSYNHSSGFPHTSLPWYFDYFYPLGCDGSGSWSPEGLTIWDLDGGRAPNINGQLHVLLFKFRATGSNREVFEHFGKRLFIDPVSGVDRDLPTDFVDGPFPGSPAAPFKTFEYTYNHYPVWDGAEIVFKSGFYQAVGTYSKRVRLVSQGGSAVLGR